MVPSRIQRSSSTGLAASSARTNTLRDGFTRFSVCLRPLLSRDRPAGAGRFEQTYAPSPDVNTIGDPAGAELHADVCVIGAGPVGLAVAHALCRTRSVVLLESARDAADQSAQELNDA